MLEGCFDTVEEAYGFIRNYEDETNTHYVIKKHKKTGSVPITRPDRTYTHKFDRPYLVADD